MKLIEEYQIDVDQGVSDAVNVLLYHFRKTSETETATCKLTAASVALGKHLMLKVGHEGEFKRHVNIGDFFLEGFYVHDFIKIDRAKTEEQIKWAEHKQGPEPRSRAPYMIEAGRRWVEIGRLPEREVKRLINNTSTTRIADVDELFQDTGYPVIKHWKYEDRTRFKDYIEEPFVKAVDVLQQTAWQIDQDILEVVRTQADKFYTPTITVHDGVGEVHEYCIFGDNDFDTSDLYWGGQPFKPHLGNKALEKKYYAELRRAVNKKKKTDRLQAKYDDAARNWNAKLVLLKNRSKHDSYLMTIKKADELKNSKFYQYVDLDYRGRIYYRETYLNYQGKDLERGLLKFHNKRKLTDQGRWYLAVHTAASYNQTYKKDELPDWLTTDYLPYLEAEELEDISVDKMTIEDRVLWTVNNQEMIAKTWEEGILHEKAEKPVVFLACCKEWHALWLSSSVDSEYLTNLPIPVDGSNNGWQHLAAISKDPQAGELVGLVPVGIQKDFYVQTAKRLMTYMPEWFEGRSMPMKHVRKGISKRGSMTRAYSAGHQAIALNMYADCYQEGFHSKYDITMTDCNDLAYNLVQAISDVCPGPLSTMSYLQKLASHIIVTRKDSYIEWVTPSGFPVKYEDYVQKDVDCRSWIADMRIKHVGKEPKLVFGKQIPSPGGFAAGISPNFIHSMDAAHMALVIADWGQDFAAVHDSYSVHADGVGEMLGMTKEYFIAMYDHEDFYECIREMFLDNPNEFTEEYSIGGLDISGIRESDYFFA